LLIVADILIKVNEFISIYIDCSLLALDDFQIFLDILSILLTVADILIKVNGFISVYIDCSLLALDDCGIFLDILIADGR